MFKSRQANWIGFQEAQKTISNLKEEVGIAEKKILDAKRSFLERTSKRKIFQTQVTSEEHIETSQSTKSKQKESHAEIKKPFKKSSFKKETFPASHKFVYSDEEKPTAVPRKELSVSEEEPCLPPFKFPHIEPLDFNSTLIKSSCDNFLSSFPSSETSVSSLNVKHLSSEGTSSLIASTLKEAGDFLKKQETKVKTVIDVCQSLTSSSSGQENLYETRNANKTKNSNQTKSEDIGLEWKEVPSNKAFFLQNRFKTDNIHKLKAIIEKQKKEQQLYLLQLEREGSSSSEHPYLENFPTAAVQQPLETVAGDEAVSVRKVCTVKSLPSYKGFNAPSKNLTTTKRWRKQKNKYTIAKSNNTKEKAANAPKRIKTVVKCDSAVVSISPQNETEKEKKNENLEKSPSEAVKNNYSNDAKEIYEDGKSENDQSCNDKSLSRNNIVADIQSILKGNELLGKENSGDSAEDAKDITFSYDDEVTPNDQNFLKENKKPTNNNVKRKAKKSLDQKVSSPKIKHYDVEKIRDYMRKKKEERKKRHLEEHRKKMHEAQKKKESLEKLLEYQKQNKKAVAKVKPLSPIKVFQQKDSIERTHENECETSNSKLECRMKSPLIHKIIDAKGRGLSDSDDDKSKNKQEFKRKEISMKNQSNISDSINKKQENVNIDISIPKLITVSDTPVHQIKSVKDSPCLIVSSGTHGNNCETVTEGLYLNKSSIESPKQVRKKKDVEDITIDNEESMINKVSDIFKGISSVSTPSEISHIIGADAKLIEEMNTVRPPLPEIRRKKDDELKNLIKSINVMTRPLEPLLRTKQWLDGNPFPPRPAKSRFTQVTNFSRQQQLVPDFQVNMSKSRKSKDSSFKEQVSGIGDVNQLYAQILGRNSSFDTRQRTEKNAELGDVFNTHQLEKTEDEIIEGSLESDVEYILDQTQRKEDIESHIETSHSPSHFYDLIKTNSVPDHFNLVNTWNRKPFGLTIYDGNVKTKGIDMPPKLSSNNIPFDEIYKSMLGMDFETEAPENNMPETPCNLPLNQEINPQQKREHSISREDTPSEMLSKISDATFENSETSSKSSIVTCDQLSRLSHIDKSIPSKKESSKQSHLKKRNPTVKQISEIQSSEGSISHTRFAMVKEHKNLKENIPDKSSNDISDVVLSGTINSEYSLEDKSSSPENIPFLHSDTKPERILLGTINSEYTLEVEKNSQESIPGVHSNNRSELLLSGSINSDYTLVSEESSKDIEPIKKEIAVDKASASGSSVSEVISVIENSKGFRSSVEDLQSNKSASSKNSEVGNHDSVEVELKSNSKSSSRSFVEDSVKSQSNIHFSQEQENTSSHSSKVVQNNSEDTALLLKNDEIQSIPNIPSGSQTNITIDFRQPLRLTLSNGEPVQSNQELDMHDSQYFHTQVITKVASEAAAAAAKSAVIAVFETQALLVEKNYSGIIAAHGRSSSNKTHYSSDFESSPTVKSSSASLHSSASKSKDSGTVPEDISNGNDKKVSPKNGLVGENVPSEFFNPDPKQLKSSQSSSIKTEENVQSVHSEDNNKNYKTSQRSKRKISGNMSSPSPASLSDNESISSETLMSSNSNSSYVNESALSDDSLAKLTLNVVRRMTKEKEVRATHQLSILQLEEKDLVQRARSEMMYLELLKKKLKQKGAERKVSSIKKRQKELILNLRQERAQLQYMQEAYRNMCEKPYSLLLEDNKKLLKGSNSLDSQLLKDEKPYTSKYIERKLNEFHKPKSSSLPTVASDYDEKTMVDEESVCEVPEILKGLTSNSSQESVVETQASEHINTSSSSQNKSQRSSPNPPFFPINAVQSNSNPSIHSNNSLETALQGLKKLEASKRHLTKREQRILQRRKQVESLLQWQKKLDNEERAVRELEQKALDLVDYSKKKAKYYVSSSASTNQEDDKGKDSIYESLPSSAETPNRNGKLLENNTPPEQSEIKTSPKMTSDESIPTNLSENDIEGMLSDKENAQASSAAHSDGSVPEEIKSGSEKSLIQTIEATENGSQPEEVVSEEISYQGSPSVKDKSSSSDVYTESFESTMNKKSPSVLSISSPFKNSSPSRNIKRDIGPGIRPPLVPRNLRRHDSSGSDDSYTISQSETASDQSDIEVRIHALAEELKRRKAEAEKLKREQKKRNRERLKEKELSLQKQLEACNQYIHQKNLELEQLSESSISPPQVSDVVVKPRIKWPRSDKVIDSRRIRKQAALSPEAFNLEKKAEFLNNSTETAENSVAVGKKDNVVRKLFPEPTVTNHEENTSKEILEKSSADSKEVSEALSASNSSEIQEVSEIDQSTSISTEVEPEKGTVKLNENSTFSSVTQNDVQSSESDQKLSSIVSCLDENKSDHDSVDSKSQTDTFITESSSGTKSSDLNVSKQSDDSTFSNKTISSDDEHSTKRVKDVFEDIIQKSDEQHSFKVSHESSSTEDSISEMQSMINSSSPEGGLDSGCSYKNSKCNSGDGCESSPKKQVIGFENEHEKLHIISKIKLDEKISIASNIKSTSVCQVQKKEFPSESEIVNIVNYMSTIFINDALHNLYTISYEKGILSNFLSHQSHENKVPMDSLNIKEKATEALMQSLFDAYLKDAFISLFSNLKNAKNYSEKSMSLFTGSANSKCDSQSTPCTSSENIFNNNSVIVVGNANEFPASHFTNSVNENKIYNESTNWNADNLVVNEREQQFQLEQQLMLQQYPYYYRKIPNKPPPPYTPPSSTSISLEFPFTKEKTVEKITTVRKVTKHIHDVIDYSVEVLLDSKQKGLMFSDIFMPAENPVADKLELTLPHQSVFIDLIFDLTKEVTLEHYSETKQQPRPWLRPRKLTPKPLIPSSKEILSKNIEKEVKKALKINEDVSDANQKKQVFWSSLKLGRKKRDFVDTILISELKEEEPDWINYDQDEITVKLQIADSILSVLLHDTVNIIKDLELKIK